MTVVMFILLKLIVLKTKNFVKSMVFVDIQPYYYSKMVEKELNSKEQEILLHSRNLLVNKLVQLLQNHQKLLKLFKMLIQVFLTLVQITLILLLKERTSLLNSSLHGVVTVRD
mmetsp:Transcript_9570/g.27313  ORF Transcript_9570/g.27313 Transcript_9570/m.27313 type:complete len:113 (-) Transcript_9570:235-573(-)